FIVDRAPATPNLYTPSLHVALPIYTAVVVSRVQIIRHVGRLRILPELWIVVSRTGIFHGTQRDATYAWHEQPAPISQSALSAVWPAAICFTREPNTSDMDSFNAPDCP